MDHYQILVSIRGLVSEALHRRPGQKLSFILFFISVVLYTQIAFLTQRTESFLLICCYSALFFLYLLLSKSILSFKFLFGFGLLFRLIFLLAVPNLSDDFFRFFWDGTLIQNRINPFLYFPREIIENPSIVVPGLDQSLFESLNSPDYFTVYPPACQLVFWVAAALSGGDIRSAVFIMKIFIFFAEVGSILLIIKLLKNHRIRKELTLLYILNPLVIIELTGNIHFEAFLIFFVLWAIYLLRKNSMIQSSLAFSLAIASKLTPVLMLPFFLKRLKFRRSILFYALTMVFTVIVFLPFMGSALINGLSSSLQLYFQKFEFNASIFYIVREIGFWIKGWDIIKPASKWLALSTVSIILIITFFENKDKQNLPGMMIWPLFIYFAFASIIHPWYITPLVAFCTFSKYRFPIVWSYTIFLSYMGYSSNGFQEHFWVLILEYGLVFGVMLYEVIKYKDLIVLKNPLPDILSSNARLLNEPKRKDKFPFKDGQ